MRQRALPTLVLALAAAAGVFWLAALPTGARAGDDEPPHLKYRKTYGEALLEGRIRNFPVFVSRHKDD